MYKNEGINRNNLPPNLKARKWNENLIIFG